MALVLDGNGPITGLSSLTFPGNAGAISGLANAAIPSTKIGAGAILQVQQVQSVGLSASTGTYPNFAGRFNVCTLTITPSSASNKIFLIYSGLWYPYDTSPSSGGQVGMIASIQRGSGQVSGTAYWQLQVNGSSTYTYYGQQTISMLDAPSTTSATTYTVGIYGWAGNSATVNLRETGGYLVAMEVAV
jgi:hypothetical protein